MDKNIVTRTFSIGAISSGAKASDDFSTARRHSSAGMRALLWATSSAASLRCSPASDSQTSRESIFQNILTPDSIPQFTIPSLTVESGLQSLDREKQKKNAESEERLGSSENKPELSGSVSGARFPFSSSSASADRRAERSVSDPLTLRRSRLLKDKSYPEAQHCLDPASRAAFSLPHLTKVTTPYGFVTLSQSPQMASEEALLCYAGLQRLNKDKKVACCLSKSPGMRAEDMKANASHLSDAKKRLYKDSADSQTKGILTKAEIKAGSAEHTVLPSASAVPRHTDGKLKRRVYEVIWKHSISHHSA